MYQLINSNECALLRYVIEEYQHPGKLRADLVLQRGLPPGPLYKSLKNGNSVRLPNGDVIEPSQVSRQLA